jgi:tol-pal system protein YbgF
MKKYVIIAIGLALLFGGCATQGDLNTVNSRLSSVESRLAGLDAASRDTHEQLEGYRSSRTDQDQELRQQAAQLYATLEQIREENRVLNGRIEEIEHTIQAAGPAGPATESGSRDQLAALGARVTRNSERIQRMEQYLNLEAPKEAETPAPPPAGKPSQPPAGKPSQLSEEEIYLAAKEAFDQKDYPGARQGFEAFLSAYPKSDNADNAQFWIGETYYREKWYEKAILEYQKVIETYPKGNKVQAALLKQGLSFFNIGDKANARLILKELISKYPGSREAELAENKLKGF